MNAVKSGRVLALSILPRGGVRHPLLDLGLVAMSTEDHRAAEMGTLTLTLTLS